MFKKCPRCNNTYELKNFHKNSSRKDGLSVYCKNCHDKDVANRVEKLKLKVFEKLGNKCNHCDCNDLSILQIDHVNSNGAIERRKGYVAYNFYNDVLKDELNAYQALCPNCNWKKRKTNSELIWRDDIVPINQNGIFFDKRVYAGDKLDKFYNQNPQAFIDRNDKISKAAKNRYSKNGREIQNLEIPTWINQDKSLQELDVDVKRLTKGSDTKVFIQCPDCSDTRMTKFNHALQNTGAGRCRVCFAKHKKASK